MNNQSFINILNIYFFCSYIYIFPSFCFDILKNKKFLMTQQEIIISLKQSTRFFFSIHFESMELERWNCNKLTLGNKTEEKRKRKKKIRFCISINVLFAEMELPVGEEGNGENRNASLATFGARSARGSRFMISKWRENFLVDKIRKLIDRT